MLPQTIFSNARSQSKLSPHDPVALRENTLWARKMRAPENRLLQARPYPNALSPCLSAMGDSPAASRPPIASVYSLAHSLQRKRLSPNTMPSTASEPDLRKHAAIVSLMRRILRTPAN
jgi:hypothetical protein